MNIWGPRAPKNANASTFHPCDLHLCLQIRWRNVIIWFGDHPQFILLKSWDDDDDDDDDDGDDDDDDDDDDCYDCDDE